LTCRKPAATIGTKLLLDRGACGQREKEEIPNYRRLTPRPWPEFIAALKDRNSSVREGAAWGLGAIRDPLALELLIALLEDEDVSVRRTVVWSLGEIKKPSGVEPLIIALKDQDSVVRYGAKYALRKITLQDFGEDSRKWQEWWKRNKAIFHVK